MRNHLPIYPKMAKLVQEWKEVIKLRNTIWPKKFHPGLDPPPCSSCSRLFSDPRGSLGLLGGGSQSLWWAPSWCRLVRISLCCTESSSNWTVGRFTRGHVKVDELLVVVVWLEKIKCPLLGRWTQAPGCGCPARRSSSSSFTATAQSGQPGKIFYKWTDKKKKFPLIIR